MKDHPETFPEAALETYVGVLRARDMIERGQLVSARNLLESIRHPDRSSWDLLARVQLRQGDYDGALMAWEKAGECGMDPAKISQCLKALE
ncbi:MAG: hypothetical protein KDN05_07600, partial [Verrucomicrobiae bacterium]|nr:hypothetical protein [Verrucomicrobiae bacterium]